MDLNLGDSDDDDDDDDDGDDGEAGGDDEFVGEDSEGSGGEDVEEQIKAEEERLLKTWGNKRKTFYNTDYVDPDLGSDVDDGQEADEEELEAGVLRARQAARFQDDDFDTLAPTAASAIKVCV
jgi:hypothetical protein